MGLRPLTLRAVMYSPASRMDLSPLSGSHSRSRLLIVTSISHTTPLVQLMSLQQPLRSSPTPFWYPGGHHHKAHKLFQRPAVIRKTRRLSQKSLDPLASGRLLCTTTT